jgi:hypothetical protein
MGFNFYFFKYFDYYFFFRPPETTTFPEKWLSSSGFGDPRALQLRKSFCFLESLVVSNIPPRRAGATADEDGSRTPAMHLANYLCWTRVT